MPEVELRAIILDNGKTQAERPGYKPVWQLNYLSGRHVPAAVGLSRPLRAPEDPAYDQPAEHQNGVHLILETLRASPSKVLVITVGSVRDIVVAYNREPELCRAKVRAVQAFIGEASDPNFVEYNVGLDPRAFARLLRSDLPVYWVPCFDGGAWQNRGHASYWKIRQADVLESAPAPLFRYFVFMLRKETSDPLAFLWQPTALSDRTGVLEAERNLWCGPFLGMLAGRRIQSKGREVAGFTPVEVTVSDAGLVRQGKAAGSRSVMLFEIRDKEDFAAAATAATAELLASFPLVRSQPEPR